MGGASHRAPAAELGERTIRLDQPQVAGILNVTPDSFSDGGKFLDRPEDGAAHAAAMLEAGAALVDIGGESTRPGAPAVWEGDELKRVIPAVEYCAAMGAAVSVDTRRAAVMAAALDAGAQIVNDVSALRHDPTAAGLVAARGCPVVLMHAPGGGDDLHADGDYDSVVFDVFDWLAARRDAAIEAGIAREAIVLDPGIGFGKSLAENLALINALPLFHALGQPLMLGASRKRMIGAMSNEAAAHQRLGGSVALAVKGMDAGVQFLRVHDVAETVQARNVWRSLRDAALTDFLAGSGLGRAVDAQVAKLAVERRAADPEAARDFGHAAAVVADREADHVGLDIVEAAQVAVVGEEHHAHPVLPRIAGLGGAAEHFGKLREAVGGQRVAVAEHRRAEQHGLELADVARPVERGEQRQRAVGDRQRAQARLFADAGEEVAGERRDVADAVAQGRQDDRWSARAAHGARDGSIPQCRDPPAAGCWRTSRARRS